MNARAAGALIGAAFMLGVSACGGGSGAPGPVPVPSPPADGSSRPAKNGDAFHYGGTLVQTFWRPMQPGPSGAPSPQPTSTTAWSVDSIISVATNTSFHGQSGLTDFAENEVDSGLQTITTVADDYFRFPAGGAGPLVETGFRSLDSNLVLLDVLRAAGNGVVDILPESGGATWANTAALTSTETDPDGQTSTRTVNADGSYAQSDAFPDGTTSSAVANPDGSGIYKVLQGTSIETDYAYGAPAGGNLTVTITQPGASPQPTPIVLTVPDWQPAGGLASDSSTINASVTVPAACALPKQFGTQGNDVADHRTAVDAIFGTLDDETLHTYVASGRGVVCVVRHDVVTAYYDFSGQNGLAFFAGTPQQYTIVDETIGLKAETVVAGVARRPLTVAQRGAVRLRLADRIRQARALHALALEGLPAGTRRTHQP